MSNRYDVNKTINGTFGRVWLDNEELAIIKSMEAKISFTKEDVNQPEVLGVGKKMLGYELSGTIALKKIDSKIVKKVTEALKEGYLPEMKIVTKLRDPAANGAERVELLGVTIDEITLAKFEEKTIVEEEIPFTAMDYNYLDYIN